MADPAESLSNLPQSIRDLVEIVGLDAALALVRDRGGRSFVVPTGERANGLTRSRLVGIMGAEAAERFMAHYPNELFQVPRCLAALLEDRNARIIADCDERGRSIPQLAEAYNLTERQIYNILKTVPGEGYGLSDHAAPDDSQLGLF